KEKFPSIDPDDYIVHRTGSFSVECLVRDKEAMRRKYADIVIDNATLEDIMLFYIKGGTTCED
ncbi:MAG: ABC transporter ATP-binding protein, partial [Lachnospiraceae bacterium]|nr:ABC transporter ATP-binding protein [Lachnospiraceae bacterium]